MLTIFTLVFSVALSTLAYSANINTELNDAVIKNDIQKVKLLINKGANVNAKGPSGTTPLMYAVTAEQIEIANLLIATGADVNAKNSNGITPLMVAANGERTEMAKLLITKGANVNAKDKWGMTALSRAEGNSDMIKLLRQAGGKGSTSSEQVPTALTAADVKFLTEKCLIDPVDIKIIPQLSKEARAKLLPLLAKRDCNLLNPFKVTRAYIKKFRPVPKIIPKSPYGWDIDYFTPEEQEYYALVISNAW